MSIDQIVSEISKVLIPVLPYLLKGFKVAGKKTAEKVGEMIPEKSFKLAEELWGKISPHRRKSRKLSIAIGELSKTPKDKSWQEMFQNEIKHLLKTNLSLLEEISRILLIEVPEQISVAKNNVGVEIEQSISTNFGKQKVQADGNQDLVIRQIIKK